MKELELPMERETIGLPHRKKSRDFNLIKPNVFNSHFWFCGPRQQTR